MIDRPVYGPVMHIIMQYSISDWILMSSSQMSFVLINGILMKKTLFVQPGFNATYTMVKKCQNHTKAFVLVRRMNIREIPQINSLMHK